MHSSRLIITDILFYTVFKLFQINVQSFAFDSGYLSLTHSLWVNHSTHDYEIWPQKNRNIALVYYAKRVSLFRYLEPCRRAHERGGQTDRQTDRKAFSNSAL